MKNRFSFIATALTAAWLLTACSGGDASQDHRSPQNAELPRPTPLLASTMELRSGLPPPVAQAAASSAQASANNDTLGPISIEDPRQILGTARALPNPWNPKNIKDLKFVTLPDGMRSRMPTGKWSKGFFYHSPLNPDAYFDADIDHPADPKNEGRDTSMFNIFPYPNKLSLDDRLGMVAVSFPTRRHIAYSVDPDADAYKLSNPYRADTLLYHIAPNGSQDMRLSYIQPGPQGLARQIDSFDELTISTSWKTPAGDQLMQVIAAEGSPYVTVRYKGLRPVVQVGQGSKARTEKDAAGLPVPGKINYAQQESDNRIEAVAIDEQPLQEFIENNTVRFTPPLSGTKFRFVYQLPDEARTAPGTNDNQIPASPLSFRELVIYASAPMTLEWDTPSRSYIAANNFTGTVRAAFVDDIASETWSSPVTGISDIPSFKARRRILDTYAAGFPTSSGILLEYDGNATALAKFQWTVERMDGQPAQGGDLLMMGFDATHIPSLQNPAKVDGLNYRSNFGMMSAVAGNEWIQKLTIPEIMRNGASGKQLWMGSGDIKAADVDRIRKSLRDDTTLLTKSFLATCNSDSYICGKYLHNVARLALIADDIGEYGMRTELVDYLKASLRLWLDGIGVDGKAIDPATNTSDDTFLYDTANGGTITSLGLKDDNKDYNNRAYVDHMFHYGYYIYAASVVSALDKESNWLALNKDKVDLLVRDIANPSMEDRFFPIVRTFDWFRMQNIADAGPDANGGNTESSSESINSNYALTAWGAVTGNSPFQALAAIMTAAEIRSAQAFYQVTPDTPYLKDIEYPSVTVTVKLPNGAGTRDIRPSSEPTMNILRSNIAETNTFFGPLLANRIGINLLPISPISAFLISGDWAKVHATTLQNVEANSTTLFNGVINTPPGLSAPCFLAGWDLIHPPVNPDGTPMTPNAGAICAGTLRTLYSWRQLAVAANGISNPGDAYERYVAYMDALPAQQEAYRQNTIPSKHPGSSLNADGVVADVLKDISTPSTDTNTLWWLSSRKP